MLHSADLNTAFTDLSNAVCKDEAADLLTIPPMHDSMVRLYQAAKLIQKVEGQSALASVLGETPQVVNNWEARGVSASGALKAQAKIGCDANWLLRNVGEMLPSWPFPKVPIERFLTLEPDDRGYVQRRLLQAIEECEDAANKDGSQPAPAPASAPLGFPLNGNAARQLQPPARSATRKRKG